METLPLARRGVCLPWVSLSGSESCRARHPNNYRERHMLLFAQLVVTGAQAAALFRTPDSTAWRLTRSSPAAEVNLAAPALAPVDTPPPRRPRAIEYSDWYYTRLTIHRIGSYTMLPLFAAEWSLGQNLLQDSQQAAWMRYSHAAVAGGIATLFTVNTLTGLWNAYDAWSDENDRTRRTLHEILMLGSDVGFAITGALAQGSRQSQARAIQHRNAAIASISVATVGTAVMWLWRQ